LVPLNWLFPGFRGGLSIRVPLMVKLSPFAIVASPSQAKNPIFERLSDVISSGPSIISKVVFQAEIKSNPSKRLI